MASDLGNNLNFLCAFEAQSLMGYRPFRINCSSIKCDVKVKISLYTCIYLAEKEMQDVF